MPRLLARAALLTALLAVLAGTGPAAVAAPRLEVSPDRDLDPAGHTVTVRGEGYDETKGIYVAWCVVPPRGQAPSPCGGGADQSGESGQSAWISTFPPPYGVGLAQPYGPGGSFRVEIRVSRYIGEVDCFVTSCAVVTRNDHTRGGDRSQDVFAPVTFRGQDAANSQEPEPAPADAPPGGGGGGASAPADPRQLAPPTASPEAQSADVETTPAPDRATDASQGALSSEAVTRESTNRHGGGAAQHGDTALAADQTDGGPVGGTGTAMAIVATLLLGVACGLGVTAARRRRRG